MNKRQKNILNKLSKEELSAIAYGFPMPSTKYYSNFSNDLESTGTTDDVNGAWKPLKSNSFDGHELDDEFDNFLTKKSRQRRDRKKQLRSEGKSRKEARKQANEEIPRTTLKEIATKVGRGVGRGIVVGAMSIPRASYLSLLALNYRGNAYKINAIAKGLNGTPSSLRNKLKDKWYKLGGDWEKLIETAENGAKKKPLFCGKKCKKALADKGLKRSFVSFNDEELDFDMYSSITGIDDVAVGTWIGLAGAVTSALAGIVNKAIESKSERESTASAERIATEENKTLSEADKRAYDLEMSKLMQEGDPATIIANNNQLSPQEKKEALKFLKQATEDDTMTTIKRVALYGGIGIVGLFIISKFFKNK